jgi:hypothetical protein
MLVEKLHKLFLCFRRYRICYCERNSRAVLCTSDEYNADRSTEIYSTVENLFLYTADLTKKSLLYLIIIFEKN